MKFVLIFGPVAVGKMTVGQELAQKTGFKLLHNHMTIEPLLNIFDYGTKEFTYLNSLFRHEILTQVAQSQLPGFIMTYAWALDIAEDKKEVDSYLEHFKQVGSEIYFVELEASENTRINRNKTKNRLEHKPSKRDLNFSHQNLIEAGKKYTENSNDNLPFFYQDNYIKIDNETATPADTAATILSKFDLLSPEKSSN
tara:strand:+ start:276 stop:866 length:591 start_codon:yes stop_codon:yes gene_type:complete